MNFPQALETLKEALSIFTEIEDFFGEAQVLTNLGIVYGLQNDYMEALKHHREALELLEEIDNPLGRAQMLSSIGLLYGRQESLEQALSSLEKAFDIFIDTDNPLGQAKASQRHRLGLLSPPPPRVRVRTGRFIAG